MHSMMVQNVIHLEKANLLLHPPPRHECYICLEAAKDGGNLGNFYLGYKAYDLSMMLSTRARFRRARKPEIKSVINALHLPGRLFLLS